MLPINGNLPGRSFFSGGSYHPLLSRTVHISQMDMASACDEILLLMKGMYKDVFKYSFYRKQNKGHWCRDVSRP